MDRFESKAATVESHEAPEPGTIKRPDAAGFPDAWLECRTPEDWRGWLEENHNKTGEVWLLIQKSRSAAPGVRLGEAVEEALCFGWIDSRMYSLNGDSFVLRFTPRRAGSPWSLINRIRAEAMIAQGRMTESGMEPIRQAQADGRWQSAYSSSRKPNAILGAIVGDIVGSRFEFNNIKTKEFDLFGPGCFATDDSIMTLAVGKAILNCRGDESRLGAETVACMQAIGRPYPECGYGGRFLAWMYSDHPAPYGSFGNGAAMRVSPCAQAAATLEEAIRFSRTVTEVTHNHPEGLKGAESVTVACFLAAHGAGLDEIRERMVRDYYPLDFTLDSIRDTYRFNETCQETVPQAIEAFLESADFEDAIRNAISIGGDSDTLAAITGAIAGSYYGVPALIRERALGYLDTTLLKLYNELESAW